MSYESVRAALIEKAKAKTKTWAITNGHVVIAHHTDAIAANKALGAVLDLFFARHPSAEGHSYDIEPLDEVVPVGQSTRGHVVFYP